jgi:tetratricopeptide (TPR) repeat protein
MMVLLAFLLTLVVPARLAGQERTPPQKPAEPFTIHVVVDRSAEGSDASSEELKRKVEKGLRKRKTWLFVTDRPDKAEGVVRVLRHRVLDEHVTTLTARVRYEVRAGRDEVAPVDYVDENYLTERHYLKAAAVVLGESRILAGTDGRQKGASLDGAASALASELETFLRENYWELADERRRRAAVGLDLPAAEGPRATASSDPPPAPSVDPAFASYLESLALYRKGEFALAASSISTLPVALLHRLATLFLVEDRAPSELKAAALLHTECLFFLPRERVSRIELARRTSLHIEIAKRYAMAIPDTAERARFLKSWHLAAAYYFYGDLRATEVNYLLGSALALFPGDPELLYVLGAFREASGTLRYREEDLAEAETIYRSLARRGWISPDLDLRLAHVLLRRGTIEEAEAILPGDPAKESESLADWMVRGLAAFERGRWTQARDSFRRAVALDSTCQACVVALASALQRSGQTERASALVKEWLDAPASSERDGWWRFLLGPASGLETLLARLRAEACP